VRFRHARRTATPNRQATSRSSQRVRCTRRRRPRAQGASCGDRTSDGAGIFRRSKCH